MQVNEIQPDIFLCPHVIIITLLDKNKLPGGESNPGLSRDRRGYSPLYYRGLLLLHPIGTPFWLCMKIYLCVLDCNWITCCLLILNCSISSIRLPILILVSGLKCILRFRSSPVNCKKKPEDNLASESYKKASRPWVGLKHQPFG